MFIHMYVSRGLPYEQIPRFETAQGSGSGLFPHGAGLHPSVLPPHSSPSSSVAAPASFSAAMATAVAAGHQLALVTSQCIPFIQPAIPANYSSPAGYCIYSLYIFLEEGMKK
jgi:hypothetical protein